MYPFFILITGHRIRRAECHPPEARRKYEVHHLKAGAGNWTAARK